MVELADTYASGAYAVRHESSSLSVPTKKVKKVRGRLRVQGAVGVSL